MSQSIMRVAVTGGAGQINYSLLFRIASGEMFGPDQPIALHILELPQALEALGGVVMELEDCAFPLLRETVIGSDPHKVFEGVDWALLVGAKPRGPGMKRGDLLRENAKIFIEQGKALNDVASKDVHVVAVGNPCNTNGLIAMTQAPLIPRKNFTAMMRLDQNRAMAQLALKSGRSVEDVSNMVVWGNHSATQVPDFTNARIDGQPAADVVGDRPWLEGAFFETVQKRGAAIIKARGKSSAASAASAVIDHVRSLVTPTPAGEWFSMSVCSDDNPYGIAPNLLFGFPCRSKGNGDWEIVPDLPWDDFLKEKIAATEKELVDEREAIM